MKRLNNENVIELIKKVHGDRYDYSLVKYINKRTPLELICKKHGMTRQLLHNVLNGAECLRCSREKRKYTNSSFISKARNIHGDRYDYSLIEYKKSLIKVKIICNNCSKTFEQLPSSHLQGVGCPYCFGNIKLDITEFIKRANEIHNNKYDYSLTKYKNWDTKVKIFCYKHGVFEQTPESHLRQKSGCKKCSLSKGEEKIRIFLEENNIKYEPQKTFKECKNKKLLPFDFYLPEYQILIEYDGRHHFEIIDCWGGEISFLERKNNDCIKNDFASNFNMKLIRIPYFELSDIENILNTALL